MPTHRPDQSTLPHRRARFRVAGAVLATFLVLCGGLLAVFFWPGSGTETPGACGVSGPGVEIYLGFECARIDPHQYSKTGERVSGEMSDHAYAIVDSSTGKEQLFRSIQTPTTRDGAHPAVICGAAGKQPDLCRRPDADVPALYAPRAGAHFLAMPTVPSAQKRTRQELALREDFIRTGDVVRLAFSFMLAEDFDLTGEAEDWRRVLQLAVGLNGCDGRYRPAPGKGHIVTWGWRRTAEGAVYADIDVAQGPSAPGCLPPDARADARRSLGATPPLTPGVWYDALVEYRIDPIGSAGTSDQAPRVYEGFLRAGIKPARDKDYVWFADAGRESGIQIGWAKAFDYAGKRGPAYSLTLGHYGQSTRAAALTMFFDEVRLGTGDTAWEALMPPPFRPLDRAAHSAD